MSNFQSSTSDKNLKFIVNMSKNSTYQHLSDADINLKSILDSDNIHNLIIYTIKQSLFYSENNNLIDSIKMSDYQDNTSLNVIK